MVSQTVHVSPPLNDDKKTLCARSNRHFFGTPHTHTDHNYSGPCAAFHRARLSTTRPSLVIHIRLTQYPATAASADVSFMVNGASAANRRRRRGPVPLASWCFWVRFDLDQVVQVGANRWPNGLLQRSHSSRSAGRRRGSTKSTRPRYRSRYGRSSRRKPSVDSFW